MPNLSDDKIQQDSGVAQTWGIISDKIDQIATRLEQLQSVEQYVPYGFDFLPLYLYSNSLAETTVYTRTFGANTIGPNGFFDGGFSGYMFNTTGAGSTGRVRLYFGGSNVFDSLARTITNGQQLSWRLSFEIYNSGVTNAQICKFHFSWDDVAFGITGVGSSNLQGSSGFFNRDTTLPQNFTLTTTLSVKSAALNSATTGKTTGPYYGP